MLVRSPSPAESTRNTPNISAAAKPSKDTFPTLPQSILLIVPLNVSKRLAPKFLIPERMLVPSSEAVFHSLLRFSNVLSIPNFFPISSIFVVTKSKTKAAPP